MLRIQRAAALGGGEDVVFERAAFLVAFVFGRGGDR